MTALDDSVELPSVAAFWNNDYPLLPARQKRRMIQEYGAFLGGLAIADRTAALPLPADCTVNLCAGRVCFKLLSDPVRLPPPRHLLAPLLCWFWVGTSRAERYRFLRAFAARDTALRTSGSAEIERDGFRLLFASWQRRVRETLSGANDYRVEQVHGFTVWRRDDDISLATVNALLPDPDRAYAGAAVCKQGSRNHTARVELGHAAYLLKRYNCRGWSYRIQNALRSSRAVKNWALLHHFRLRGIPVPDPVLCLEERRWRLLGRSYIVMDFCAGETLRKLWPDLGESERKSLMASLALSIGRMHRFGLVHGDLKWDNILVRRERGGLQIRLIDFDGARVVGSPSRRCAEKDLRRFLRDLRRYDRDGCWERRFIHSWSTCLAQL